MCIFRRNIKFRLSLQGAITSVSVRHDSVVLATGGVDGVAKISSTVSLFVFHVFITVVITSNSQFLYGHNTLEICSKFFYDYMFKVLSW